MWDPRSVLPPPRWRLNRLQVVAIAHAKGIGPSEPAKGSVDHGKFEEVRRQRLPRWGCERSPKSGHLQRCLGREL